MARDDRTPQRGRSIPYRLIAAGVAAALVIILIVQNVADVSVDWLFWSTQLPLSLLVVLVAVLSFLAGWLLSRLRR